jgi:predicted membrane channel-forming protein YqfA (hemolysin III family)
MLPEWYKYFNYGSIIVIAILLLLMLTETVPKESFFGILIFAIALLLLRVIFRVYFVMKSKKAKEE